MDSQKLAEAADPKTFAAFIQKLSEMPHHRHGGDGSIEVTREAEHNAHHIVIRTTYRIEVDGLTRAISLNLDNDGQVYCHALPNFQFDSAIEMVKRIIDAYPEEFSRDQASGPQGGGHSGHIHMNPPPHEH